MTMITLEAQARIAGKALGLLKKSGKIPAVVYGTGISATTISVDAVSFKKALKEAGESTTVTLLIDGKKIPTLIQEVVFEPIAHKPMHVDFYAVDMNKTIEVSVPIEWGGESAAVKAGLGSLVKVMHEIQVEALPADLPHELHVDISTLVTLDDQIHAKDIVLPKGVTLKANADDVVALVAAQKEEKEEVPFDPNAVLVEEKGKKEDADAPAEEAKAE